MWAVISFCILYGGEAAGWTPFSCGEGAKKGGIQQLHEKNSRTTTAFLSSYVWPPESLQVGVFCYWCIGAWWHRKNNTLDHQFRGAGQSNPMQLREAGGWEPDERQWQENSSAITNKRFSIVRGLCEACKSMHAAVCRECWYLAPLWEVGRKTARFTTELGSMTVGYRHGVGGRWACSSVRGRRSPAWGSCTGREA